jgi:hypothetical protein
MARALASFLMNNIKENPERYLKRGVYPFSISDIAGQTNIDPEKHRLLGNLKLIINEDPSAKEQIKSGGATYYRRTGTDSFPRQGDIRNPNTEPLTYEIEPRDISIKYMLKIRNPKINLSAFFESLESRLYHELKHFVDDIGGDPFERQSDMPKEITGNEALLNKVNYLLRDTEVRAFAEQSMNDSRTNKKDYLVNVADKINSARELLKKLSGAGNENEIEKALKILEFKILDYAKKTYARFNEFAKDSQGNIIEPRKPSIDTLRLNTRRANLSKQIEKESPSYFGTED